MGNCDDPAWSSRRPGTSLSGTTAGAAPGLPFHDLAEQERELVCGMNERLIEGMVRGLGNETLDVALDPLPGQCCVRIGPQPR